MLRAMARGCGFGRSKNSFRTRQGATASLPAMTTDMSHEIVADAVPEPATSGYASAALAFSMVGAVLLGVFCAIAALTQPDTTPKAGARR